MDVFREWMLTLVFLAAGGSLLEQAAPDGSLKKYVSFIISMVIGSVIFGAGALLNVWGGTNDILNACSMLAIHFLFILVSFRMDITTSAFYTIF